MKKLSLFSLPPACWPPGPAKRRGQRRRRGVADNLGRFVTPPTARPTSSKNACRRSRHAGNVADAAPPPVRSRTSRRAWEAPVFVIVFSPPGACSASPAETGSPMPFGTLQALPGADPAAAATGTLKAVLGAGWASPPSPQVSPNQPSADGLPSSSRRRNTMNREIAWRYVDPARGSFPAWATDPSRGSLGEEHVVVEHQGCAGRAAHPSESPPCSTRPGEVA